MIAHNLTPIENEETSMRDDPTRGFGLLTMKRSEVSQSRQSTSLCLAAKCPTLIRCLSDQSLGGWVGQHVKVGLAQSWSNGSGSLGCPS